MWYVIVIPKLNTYDNEKVHRVLMCVDVVGTQSLSRTFHVSQTPDRTGDREVHATDSGGAVKMVPELVEVAALSRRIASGDRAAESEMVKLYEPGLRRVLWRKTNCREDLEDLINEVWIRALPKLRQGSINDPSALPGYLNGFARGVASNFLKSSAYKATKNKVTEPEHFWHYLPDPFKSLSEEQLLTIIGKLMEEMRMERDREILRRFLVNEEDKDVLCKEFGLTEKAFNSVLSRARNRLRKLAKPYLDEHDQ